MFISSSEPHSKDDSFLGILGIFYAFLKLLLFKGSSYSSAISESLSNYLVNLAFSSGSDSSFESI